MHVSLLPAGIDSSLNAGTLQPLRAPCFQAEKRSLVTHTLLAPGTGLSVCFFLAAFTYIGLPAMLRMVNVVVAYFKEYRVKYGRFMKRNFMLGVWAVGAAALTVRGWIYFGSRSVHYSR